MSLKDQVDRNFQSVQVKYYAMVYQTSHQDLVWPWCAFVFPILAGYWCRCAHVNYSLDISILSRWVCVFEWYHIASIWNPLKCEDCLIWVCTLLCLPIRDNLFIFSRHFIRCTTRPSVSNCVVSPCIVKTSLFQVWPTFPSPLVTIMAWYVTIGCQGDQGLQVVWPILRN